MPNLFLDQAGAVQAFVQALIDALGSDLVPELTNVLTEIIKNELNELLTNIVTHIFANYSMWYTIPNPIAVIPIAAPVLRQIEAALSAFDEAKAAVESVIGDIEAIKETINEYVSKGQMAVDEAKQMANQLIAEGKMTIEEAEAMLADAEAAAGELAGNLIAMGQMTLGEATAKFIEKLIESLSSSPVMTALTNIVESLLRLGPIYDLIEQTVQSIASSLYFTIYLPFPLPPLEIPKIELPTLEVSATVPCGTGQSAQISAKLGTLGQFQAEMMAPKMYDTILTIIQTLEKVVTTELPGIISGVVAGLPPPPS